MSNGGHDDVIIIKKASAALIALAAIVGGVAGYLICHFVSKEEAADYGIDAQGQAAVYQPYEAPDSMA